MISLNKSNEKEAIKKTKKLQFKNKLLLIIWLTYLYS